MSKLGRILTVAPSSPPNSASVIFLHGSGDTGRGILDWIRFLMKDFSLPHVKFVFPTAPQQSYIPLNGELSNVWFNRYDITPEAPDHHQSLDLIKLEVNKLISTELESGIPLNRILIGGFSMGGALALHTAYRFNPGLAGVFTLSSFLSKDSAVYSELKAVETPLFMYHGDRDTLVPPEWGQATFDKLTSLGVKGEFRTIKNTLHELKRAELDGLLEWIKRTVPS